MFPAGFPARPDSLKAELQQKVTASDFGFVSVATLPTKPPILFIGAFGQWWPLSVGEGDGDPETQEM